MIDSQAGTKAASPPGYNPALQALMIIEKYVHRAKRTRKFPDIINAELRAVAIIRSRLDRNPADPEAVKWLKQLAIAWSTRLSGDDPLTFRILFRILETCPSYPR